MLDSAVFLSDIDVYNDENIFVGMAEYELETEGVLKPYNTFSVLLNRSLFVSDGKYEITTQVNV